MAAPSTDTDGNGIAADVINTETTSAADVAAADSKTEGFVEPAEATAGSDTGKEGAEIKKWPGWPGDNVFRMIVPVLKVGSIIGKKGELIKKLCEETRANIRILEGAVGTADRIVLISGKEEPEADISPAMDAVLRVFKRINGISDSGVDGTTQTLSIPAICSVRLLVASSQGINLIGKQGTSIKSIQENTGATIRVITGDELPFYATGDERVVDIQGESLKVLKALEAVVGHLRKFLVDHSVLPLFKKSLNAPQPTQDRAVDAWADKAQLLIQTAHQSALDSDYTLPLKRDSSFLERESQLDSPIQRPGLSSLYRQEPALSGLRSSGFGHTSGAVVTQVIQTMQIPLSYARDIVGIGGGNIAFIRRTSGAVLTVQGSEGLPDEITLEIKGGSVQVQTAQQLIQDFIAGHKDPAPSRYGSLDTGLRSSYSHLASTAYPSSSLTSQSYSGYGSSGLGGYDSYRY